MSRPERFEPTAAERFAAPLRVAVLGGGPDAEHEVSLRSAEQVATALRTLGRFEVIEVVVDRPSVAAIAALDAAVIFPVLHGPYGEGGPLQETLVEAGVPFVGSGPDASRLAIDKLECKRLAERVGVPTPESERLYPGLPSRLEPPVVVKPVDDGSSVGVRICADRASFEAARRDLHPVHPRLMAERFIAGREITVGIVAGHPLPLIEVIPATGFYGYEEKYLRDDTRYDFEPRLPESIVEGCRRHAMAMWDALGCRDLARVDFMVDADGPWLLEVNTMPGMTDHSLVPKAAARAGCPMPQLCESLVEAALRRGAAIRRAAVAEAGR